MRRLLIGCLLLAGCVTPSIPIPPPSPEKMSFDLAVENGQSQAVFHYEAEANYIDSIVYVYNRDRGVGVIVDANPDGSVGPTPPVAGALGEQIVVTFERDDQTVSTCVRLREQPSSTEYCGP